MSGGDMNSNWYKLVMRASKVRFGKNLLLKGCPFIYNKKGAELTIGNNVTVKSSFLSNLVGLYSRTIIVTRAPGAYIRIGDNVGMSGVTIEAETRNKLLMDKNGGDSDLIPAKPIKIGRNCFIGCNAIILKGTELGDGCVVGAGAVVSGKFEPDSVIVGNPARCIRKVGES